MNKKIQLEILHGMPSLLSKCISTLPLACWEPDNSILYQQQVSHLILLTNSVAVDTKLKSTIRSALTNTSKKSFRAVFDSDIHQSFIPKSKFIYAKTNNRTVK
jgi:hypothetical protein